MHLYFYALDNDLKIQAKKNWVNTEHKYQSKRDIFLHELLWFNVEKS